MRSLRVRITSVDSYGFCGRDHHPTDDDVGRTVVVFRYEVESDGEVAYGVYYGRFEDNPAEMVELIDHEVAVLPLSTDPEQLSLLSQEV